MKDCNIIEAKIELEKSDFKYLISKFKDDERYLHNQANFGEL